MREMFSACESLTSLDLSSFNTANVFEMSYLFAGCSSLTALDLSSFNTLNVQFMNRMFMNCDHLVTIYASKGWSTDSVIESNEMFLGCTSLVGEHGTVYDENHVDVAYAHFDLGLTDPGYLSRKRSAYALISADQTTLTFYYDDERTIRPTTTYPLNTGITSPGWSEYAGGITQVVIDSTFVIARPTTTYCWFNGMTNLDSISGITYLNTSSVTDMRRMFAGCNTLTTLDLSGFNTSNVTNMWAMFADCDSLVSLDLSSFNTAKVTNMARMFSDCDTLTYLNLSTFRADSLKDMAGMFAGCKHLTALDLSGFNTSNLRYMGHAFSGCKSLESLDLSGLNTSRVTEMEYMFRGCESLAPLDLSNFYTANVTNTERMFEDCKSLRSLDLGRFNTKKVWNMEAMFEGCNHLETIYAGRGWRTDAATESDDMFYGCTELVGGLGTTYDENYVDATRAHIDGGPSNPGYLTGNAVSLLGDVNGDGEVNIADVNCLISVIQGDTDDYEGTADVNDDGEVTIADINTVIDIILGDS